MNASRHPTKLLFPVLLIPSKALAHSVGGPQAEWWKLWNSSPVIVISLGLIGAIYVHGYSRLKQKGLDRQQVRKSQTWAFGVGMLSLVLALLSPIDPLSDFLAWVHMLQHSLLMMVAAPLIAWSSPAHLSLWSLPARVWHVLARIKRWAPASLRRRLGRPLAIWTLYSVTLWFWHVPYLYEAALHNSFVHDLQHLSFFVTSYFFWKLLIDPYARSALLPGLGLIYIFVASLHAMILGILMALSPVPWYEFYVETAPFYGLSALRDQQLAGLIMWMPAGSTYVVVSIFLLLKLISPSSVDSRLRP
jgi:putative membrane protein